MARGSASGRLGVWLGGPKLWGTIALALAFAPAPALAQDIAPNAEPIDVALKTGSLLP